MTKVLLNDYEALTHARLEPVCAGMGARVFAKVRLADVLPIEGSGVSARDFRFALQSHFDFVVADADHRALFAVEYDGASHRNAVQIARDAVKNSLCDKFGFPLLRINSRYLDSNYRGFDLLTWFVEVWFTARAFDEAQQAGHIPWDEPFDALSVLHIPGRRGIFPLWLGREQLLRFQEAHKRGEIHDWGPSDIVGVDANGDYRAIAYIRISTETGIYAKTGMRSQRFDISPSEVLGDLVLFDLWARYQQVLDGSVPARPMSDVQNAIERFNDRTAMCRASLVSHGNKSEP